MSEHKTEASAIRLLLSNSDGRCRFCGMPDHLGRELHAGYCCVELAREQLASLEAENARLEAQLVDVEAAMAAYRTDAARNAEKVFAQSARLATLEAALAEARKDRARLDWLDANDPSLGRMWMATTQTDHNGDHGEIELWYVARRDKPQAHGETLRAAIDAARHADREDVSNTTNSQESAE